MAQLQFTNPELLAQLGLTPADFRMIGGPIEYSAGSYGAGLPSSSWQQLGQTMRYNPEVLSQMGLTPADFNMIQAGGLQPGSWQQLGQAGAEFSPYANMTIGGQAIPGIGNLAGQAGAGLPEGSVDLANQLLQYQQQFTPGGVGNIPTGTPNLQYSGNQPLNPMDVIKKLLNQGGDQQGQTGQPTGLSGILGGLGDIWEGIGKEGTAIPLAMLAYLNQKDFEYPNAPQVQWPSWMEQLRQDTMQPEEYDIASQSLQGLLGTDPTESIMAGLTAQQDIDRQKYEKYMRPQLASAGQLDSTYSANVLGDYLAQQQAQALGQRGELAQWVPQFQAGVAGQLGSLGAQRGATGQGWYGQGMDWTQLANTPGQRGFELEYQKIADQEANKNKAEQLWSAIMMGNMFPQNPIFRQNWGTGQQQPWGSISGTGGQQTELSDLEKALGYGKQGIDLWQTGQGLWNVGKGILNWF